MLRRRAALAALVLILAVAVAWISSLGQAGHRRAANARGGRVTRAAARSSPAPVAVTPLPYTLPEPLQDAAAVALASGRAALLGGLDAAETSTAAVSLLDARASSARGQLPEAQHDAQGALLDRHIYVFGGGQVSSYAHILSYDPATGQVNTAASLPTPTSDAAVATIAGTAYVVGGYTGERPLDTIVAWRPGMSAQVVAHLPTGLRYAAVAASGGRVLIAGGSHGGAATAAILSFDPARREVRRLGELPAAVTHAAAVALGGYVYVLGGRGTAPGSQTASIIAVDPATGRSMRVGSLPRALSDAAAVSFGDRAWLAGGLSADGPVASVLELTPTR